MSDMLASITQHLHDNRLSDLRQTALSIAKRTRNSTNRKDMSDSFTVHVNAIVNLVILVLLHLCTNAADHI